MTTHDSPPLQKLADDLIAAAKTRDAIRDRINKETDFDNRYHALRHEQYLLEVKYGWHDADKAYEKAKRALQEQYSDIMGAIYEMGEWGP